MLALVRGQDGCERKGSYVFAVPVQVKEITEDYGSTEGQWEPGLASTVCNPTLNALVQ